LQLRMPTRPRRIYSALIVGCALLWTAIGIFLEWNPFGWESVGVAFYAIIFLLPIVVLPSGESLLGTFYFLGNPWGMILTFSTVGTLIGLVIAGASEACYFVYSRFHRLPREA